MPTELDVREALDQATREEFTIPAPPNRVAVIFGNMVDVSLSKGTAPYIKQKVIFQSNSQAELGNQCFRRNRGYVLFIIHYRKGQGDLTRDNLQMRVRRAFASKLIGGATMQNLLMVASTETENWAIVGLQIPFYFDDNSED
jgi:hypothetical protein